MSDDTNGIVRDCADLLPEIRAVEIPGDLPPGVSVLALPEGHRHEVLDLDAFNARPRFLRQTVRLCTADDLAEYVLAYDAGRTRIFADPDSRNIEAVLDYHEGPAGDGAPAAARCYHRARCDVQFDPAFAAWHGLTGEIGQKAFAEFLEDRAEDAVAPEPADLMEVAQRFDAMRKVEFRSAVNLADGTRQFAYQEADSVQGAVAVPRTIALRVPVLEGQAPRDFAVRFGYRIDDGKLLFRVRIHRCEDLLRAAWDDLVAALREAAKVPVHLGTLG